MKAIGSAAMTGETGDMGSKMVLHFFIFMIINRFYFTGKKEDDDSDCRYSNCIHV